MLISERITYIQTLFRRIHEAPRVSEDPLEEATDVRSEYLSVVYEARAAQLAAEDFQLWKAFFSRFAHAHRSQLLVGLGWSMAESESYALFSEFPSSSDNWRIADGCGYYAGLFKRREAVRQQTIPEALPKDLHAGFDQGLGRSFWYLMHGDPERIQELIAHFATSRQSNLWRGVGVAMTYVGGMEEELIDKTTQCAGSFLPSLKCGVLLALDGRSKTGIETAGDRLLKQQLALPEAVDFQQELDFALLLSEIERSLAH